MVLLSLLYYDYYIIIIEFCAQSPSHRTVWYGSPFSPHTIALRSSHLLPFAHLTLLYSVIFALSLIGFDRMDDKQLWQLFIVFPIFTWRAAPKLRHSHQFSPVRFYVKRNLEKLLPTIYRSLYAFPPYHNSFWTSKSSLFLNASFQLPLPWYHQSTSTGIVLLSPLLPQPAYFWSYFGLLCQSPTFFDILNSSTS